MNGREESRKDWLFDGSGEPDGAEREVADSLRAAQWKGDEAALLRAIGEPGAAAPSPGAPTPARGARPAPRRLVASVVSRRGAWTLAATLALALTTWLVLGRAPATAWKMDSGSAVRQGQWITTSTGDEVEISSSIGRVTVGPDSRVRMVRADEDQHRLELAEGSIDAFIFAPPRLFFVDTPTATAVDMGCAYTLDVAQDGSGRLRVTGGWVQLEAEPVPTRVPAGAVCRIGADGALGLPRFEDAAPEFVSAADRLEAGDPAALDSVLQLARARDSLTVWHLLSRTEGEDRRRVAERLAGLAPPAEDGVPGRAESLDDEAMEAWWAAVRRSW